MLTYYLCAYFNDGITIAAVCQYPEVKDDVIVTGKGFTYASKGVRLKCISPQARQIRGNKRSKCLADSTWSIQNFNCSSERLLYIYRYVQIL